MYPVEQKTFEITKITAAARSCHRKELALLCKEGHVYTQWTMVPLNGQYTCVAPEPHVKVHSTCVHVNEIIMCYPGMVQTSQLMYDMHYALYNTVPVY